MMKVAVWTPLPPARSGIADYSYRLIEEMAGHADVRAVVSDRLAAAARAPEGVEIVPASAYDARDVDIDVYHMGNNAHVHGYMHGHALSRPGMLVLHDPALVDLYKRIGGGPDGVVFNEEIGYNFSLTHGRQPTIEIDGRPVLDPLALMMSRRLVEGSRITIVHSSWAAKELQRRSPAADIVYIPEATVVADAMPSVKPPSFTSSRATEQSVDGSVVFGVFGGLSRPKRPLVALEAFAALYREHAHIRLVIAGRTDDAATARDVVETIHRHGLSGAVELLPDIATEEEFEGLLLECTAVIALRWPTVGETSAIVMRAFGAGRIVIVSDVPQYRELDTTYCWRVPTETEGEVVALERVMRSVVADPRSAHEAGALARSFVSSNATFAAVAKRHLALLKQLVDAAPASGSRVGHSGRPQSELSVNAIASWEATTGLTEAARRAVDALVVAGVGVAMEDFDYGAPRVASRYPDALRALPRGRPHATDLCFLNINELHVATDAYLRQSGRPRRLIASWFWELAGLPADQRLQIDRVDEIWVATEFVADVFRQYTRKPVHVVSCVVEPVMDQALTRSDFGLKDDRVLFFFNFDANSTLARKNPRAVIEAYRRAFSPQERASKVGLVMKTINLKRLPEANLMLRGELDHVGGQVIDEDMTPQEVAALTAACDVYVSLHRAEGFGLGIAEAMYFGRPVIATGYSGSVDFMRMSNSYPIGYHIVKVEGGDLRFNPTAQYVYRPGELWAEPDIDEAARRMRYLYEHPKDRARIGDAAARTIREQCSRRAVGARMRELLARAPE